MAQSERLQTDDLVRDGDEPLARDGQQLQPLFAEGRATELRNRWQSLQSRFVDDPRETVEEADALVADLLQELARSFSDARSNLERQWNEGDDASTEDLRLTLQRYRSFFERLLSV
jgi:polyhydroxyalkanoate synthesis regulator phasin